MVFVKNIFAQRLALRNWVQWEQRQLEKVQVTIEQGVCEQRLCSKVGIVQSGTMGAITIGENASFH